MILKISIFLLNSYCLFLFFYAYLIYIFYIDKIIVTFLDFIWYVNLKNIFYFILFQYICKHVKNWLVSPPLIYNPDRYISI